MALCVARSHAGAIPGRMKLSALGPIVVTLATALITGCGPGLTTRASAANAPTNVELAMDAELSHALIGTTTLTSAPLPSTRAPLEPWSAPASQPAAEATAPQQTWGTSPELDPKFSAEYGF
jgi:hypothetical protein